MDAFYYYFFFCLIALAASAAKLLQSCSTLRPHRRQPTRLPCPWDSPGKNTGVGCHFRLQCMKVNSESEVAQLCPTPSDPMNCSLPGSSIHGISQARALGCNCLLRIALARTFITILNASLHSRDKSPLILVNDPFNVLLNLDC